MDDFAGFLAAFLVAFFAFFAGFFAAAFVAPFFAVFFAAMVLLKLSHQGRDAAASYPTVPPPVQGLPREEGLVTIAGWGLGVGTCGLAASSRAWP